MCQNCGNKTLHRRDVLCVKCFSRIPVSLRTQVRGKSVTLRGKLPESIQAGLRVKEMPHA